MIQGFTHSVRRSTTAVIFSCMLLLLTLFTLQATAMGNADELPLAGLNDSTRVLQLLKSSRSHEMSDPVKSLEFAAKARNMAREIGFERGEVRAMIMIGTNYTRMMKLAEAIEMGEQIIDKASRYGMQLEVADGRSIIAVAYAQGGDFDNSSRLYFENLELYEKLKEKKLLARTLGNIGADFIEQHSYDKALEYTNKALQAGLKSNDQTLVMDQYNNLAAIYLNAYQDYPSALFNYGKALEVAEKISDFPLQGNIILNTGHVYLQMNQPDSALPYIEKSLTIFKKLNNDTFIGNCYVALGICYFKKGDYRKAKEYSLASLQIAQRLGMLQTTYEAANLLHQIGLLENNVEHAYKYHVILSQAKDSIYDLQNKKELFKLESKYNQEKLVKEQKLKQQKYYFILGLVILGLLSSLAIIVLFNSRQKIKIRNAALLKENLESELKFKSKELSVNLMSLIKKNELITEISSKLAELEKAATGLELKDTIIKLNHSIKQNSDDRLGKEFTARFSEINREFYDKLLKQFPGLTQSELKLCAYLRLNMSTKEISDLTGQSIEAIGKSRYRLRKKFDLTNSDSNLVLFLTQI